MGKVPLQALDRVQAGGQEWEDPVVEEWAVPEPVEGREGNVCVQNAARLLLMKSEHPVTL